MSYWATVFYVVVLQGTTNIAYFLEINKMKKSTTKQDKSIIRQRVALGMHKGYKVYCILLLDAESKNLLDIQFANEWEENQRGLME